ncbi:MAG: hypothetical protein EOP50_04035 [Sphingobacteriales bacterium]|nr:MAG: hypothetical protein EOP50_04035 [Sphingobacteriales bacterium]
MRSRLLFLLLLAAACQSAPSSAPNESKPGEVLLPDRPENSSAAPDRNTTSGEQCYRQVLGRDTFTLRVRVTGGKADGTLVFDNYEKDSSHGTVTGTEQKGVLQLWYRFRSEGMESVQQVYFKRDGNAVLRAVGPVDVKGDTALFRDPSAVTYSAKDRWEAMDCGH